MKYFMRILFSIFIIGDGLWATDLVVGTTSAYAPFVSLDEQGQYVGFDIDIAEELANKLGRSLVIKDLGSMPALFLALKQNKVDLLIWAISITEERQKQMEMIYYQGEKVIALPLLFWKQIPDKITSIEEMANVPNGVISVEAGSFAESFLLSVPGLNLKQVDKVMDSLLELKYGKSLATMVDPSLLTTILEKFPEIKVLNIPLPPSAQALGYGICVNKSNQTLIAQVKQAVAELRSAGKIAELERKWNLTRSDQ
ncbi:MAG: transporter substrate-binding domain-containing protein [Chlamydiales bacterium]